MNQFLIWFMNIMRRLVLDMFFRLRSSRSELDKQEDIYTSMIEKEELLTPVRNDQGFRKRIVHVVGSLVSSDGVAWDEEELSYEDEDGIETEVIHREARRCSCGAALGYSKGADLLGTCRVCGRS